MLPMVFDSRRCLADSRRCVLYSLEMFNSITGRLSEKRADAICIDTGGVEWELSVPARSVDDFGRIGDEARAFAWLHHYDDGMRLYGFPTESDRQVFRELMKVEGIGPKQAMRILSGIKPEALGAALDAGDLGALQAIPGVGPKLAQKMMLALKGKLVSGPMGEREGSSRFERRVGRRGQGPGRHGLRSQSRRESRPDGRDRDDGGSGSPGQAAKAASGEREREVFRAALLDLSAGS